MFVETQVISTITFLIPLLFPLPSVLLGLCRKHRRILSPHHSQAQKRPLHRKRKGVATNPARALRRIQPRVRPRNHLRTKNRGPHRVHLDVVTSRS